MIEVIVPFNISSVFRHNTEKVVYFLLLDRKVRNPTRDDEDAIRSKSEIGEWMMMSQVHKMPNVL